MCQNSKMICLNTVDLAYWRERWEKKFVLSRSAGAEVFLLTQCRKDQMKYMYT